MKHLIGILFDWIDKFSVDVLRIISEPKAVCSGFASMPVSLGNSVAYFIAMSHHGILAAFYPYVFGLNPHPCGLIEVCEADLLISMELLHVGLHIKCKLFVCT